MSYYSIRQLEQLNRWIQVYDLEWAKACALGDSTIPLWYTNKCKVWVDLRDGMVWDKIEDLDRVVTMCSKSDAWRIAYEEYNYGSMGNG